MIFTKLEIFSIFEFQNSKSFNFRVLELEIGQFSSFKKMRQNDEKVMYLNYLHQPFSSKQLACFPIISDYVFWREALHVNQKIQNLAKFNWYLQNSRFVNFRVLKFEICQFSSFETRNLSIFEFQENETKWWKGDVLKLFCLFLFITV